MSEGKKYYCFCSSNCKYETMTKEQIMAAITQAVQGGRVGNVDTGFVTKIKEKNSGGSVTFWVGTQVQYNALKASESVERNCVYIITDDPTKDDIAEALEKATKAAEAATAAAEAATAAAGELKSCTFTFEAVKTRHVRFYENGIAEAFVRYVSSPANITNVYGSMYASNAFNVPYPDCIAEDRYDYVMTSAFTMEWAQGSVCPVGLMAASTVAGAPARYVYVSPEPVEGASLCMNAHYVWLWKGEETTAAGV